LICARRLGGRLAAVDVPAAMTVLDHDHAVHLLGVARADPEVVNIVLHERLQPVQRIAEAGAAAHVIQVQAASFEHGFGGDAMLVALDDRPVAQCFFVLGVLRIDILRQPEVRAVGLALAGDLRWGGSYSHP
jgi:hypothetical protein